MSVRATRPIALALLVGALLAVPDPAGAALAPRVPAEDGQLTYRNGLEPGTELGGMVLPMEWSQRDSFCDDPNRAVLHRRLAAWSTPNLCPGDVSDAVIHLQSLLTEKKLYRSPLTGVYDDATRYAVIAFHKIIGPAHDQPATAYSEWREDPPPEDWSVDDWALLADFDPKPPKFRLDQPYRVEVDIGHQVLYLIEDDEVDAIIPVSTGAGRGTIGCRNSDDCNVSVTPRTTGLTDGSTFYYEHNYGYGWSPRPGEWSIYKAIFYRGGHGEWNYGIHGYRVVPSYPASHGCIRVTVWDMDYLRPDDGRHTWGSFAGGRVHVGMTIHVWDR